MFEIVETTDAARLSKLYPICFDGEPWGEESVAKILSSGCKALLVTDGLVDIGLIVFRLVLGEAEIIEIGVVPAYQNKGFGKKILERLKQEKIEKIFLEVAEDNKSAREFYQKNGFIETGKRKDYYLDNGRRVDAILMECLV